MPSEPVIVDEYPLAYGQRTMWFVQRLAPDSAAYNVLAAFRVRGQLDVEAFVDAWQRLTDRHEALRTTYHDVDGVPVQRLHARLPIESQVVDVVGQGQAEVQAKVAADAHRPFDLQSGPIVRLRLYRCSEAADEHVFLLAIHHIAIDATALGFLLGELGRVYPALRDGKEPPELPALPWSFGDFVHWQLERLEGPGGAELRQRWYRRLSASPPQLNLPFDRPRSTVQTFGGAMPSATYAPDLVERLRAVGQKVDVPLRAVFLAAFQALLYRYSGQTDILVGSPVSGRTRPEMDRLVGFFVNTIVIRADLSAATAGTLTFRDLLRHVGERFAEAEAGQDYPFTLLVEQLQPDRSQGQSPFFQVLFVLYGGEPVVKDAPDPGQLQRMMQGEGGSLATGDLQLEAMPVKGESSMLDLSLLMHANETPDGTRVDANFQYNTHLFDGSTIDTLMADYRTLLEAVASNADRPVAGLPASLGVAERKVSEEAVQRLSQAQTGKLDDVRSRAQERLQRRGQRRVRWKKA